MTSNTLELPDDGLIVVLFFVLRNVLLDLVVGENLFVHVIIDRTDEFDAVRVLGKLFCTLN